MEATSNEFIVDETPPVAGWVTIASSSPTDSNTTQIAARYEYLCTKLSLRPKVEVKTFLSYRVLLAIDWQKIALLRTKKNTMQEKTGLFCETLTSVIVNANAFSANQRCFDNRRTNFVHIYFYFYSSFLDV